MIISEQTLEKIVWIERNSWFRDTAGEEDHATYNLRVLKKPVFTVSDHPRSGRNHRIEIRMRFPSFSKIMSSQPYTIDHHWVDLLKKS